ncbi:hypothetical protein GIB67_028206 [Kingdonia uniflora]|uniref:Aminotransferase-like plant mobile domain-containing protein n=1 Tax=Kingdonia uniflora TaxID=39325 RepID=A0A7J7KZ32_9MAGN|nr:hypothetical protein GIB67_028206 [Kingdonia uniflora]
MSLEEGECDGTGEDEGSESDYSEGHVSQLHLLLDKKKKNNFEKVVNVSIEPPPPLLQNYEAHDFQQLTQPDGNSHLSTSVATTSARVGFKCKSVLVKLCKIYLILIEVPHLKQRLKATNLMSVFDCKIENEDHQVILVMIEHWWPTTHTFHLPYGELGITLRDFTVLTGIGIGTGKPMEFDESSTDYGNAIRVFPDMMPIDYEKGCIGFAHLRAYLDHTRVNIRDPSYANTIFKAFMLLYFGGVLSGNLKSWARLEFLCPIAILENKAYTIDFGSAILGHLYYCLDQASKQEEKYIGGLFQLIKYHYYEYCQIGHHILIDNRNMKDALKREVIITGNISRKRVLLQCPFGGCEWYLGDRCWDQLEHRPVPYDPPEKLYCFPTSDVVRSLRAAGWIEAQNYIVSHHVDYVAYWRHVSHGALMSDIVRSRNIDIPGLGALTNGVTFPHVEFPTTDFSTQETQIPPPRLGDYPGWIMELGSPHGTMWHTITSIALTSTIDVPSGYDFFAMTKGMRKLTLDRTLDLEARHLHDESRITHLTADLGRVEGRLF